MYIFYKLDTLKIMGMSTNKNSMEFPSIETEENYHSTFDLQIIEENNKYIIKPINLTINDEIISELNKNNKVYIDGKEQENGQLILNGKKIKKAGNKKIKRVK